MSLNTAVIEIPLLGTSAYHHQNLSQLDAIISKSPERLIVKFLGPGGLAPEAVLAYHDMLGTLTYATEIVTVSYTNLIGGDLALFLLGNPRDIRPSAWCYVYSSSTWAFERVHDDCERGRVAIAENESGAVMPSDWRHHFWDYQQCLRLINEHVAVNEIIDRRLDVADLKEHLVIDSGVVDALLLRQLTRGETAVVEKPSKARRKRPPQSGTESTAFSR